MGKNFRAVFDTEEDFVDAIEWRWRRIGAVVVDGLFQRYSIGGEFRFIFFFGGKCDFEGPNDELLQLELVLLSGVGGRIVFCCVASYSSLTATNNKLKN